jgi:hypothetical protein
MTHCRNNRAQLIATGLGLLFLETGFSNGLASQRAQHTETIVFRNVTALPMDHDAAVAGQDVVVQDGTITAIAPPRHELFRVARSWWMDVASF